MTKSIQIGRRIEDDGEPAREFVRNRGNAVSPSHKHKVCSEYACMSLLAIGPINLIYNLTWSEQVVRLKLLPRTAVLGIVEIL